MSNPLYNQYGNNMLMQRFNQFRQQFKGDPRQQIQQMLNNGQITQQQYDQAVQKAKILQNLLGIK